MSFRIDASLYPDVEPPATLDDAAARADFIERLCGAWDFGLLPDGSTIVEVRSPLWREAVDLARLLTSPTYHLLREWHRLPPLPFLGSAPAGMTGDPNLAFI